MEGCILRVSVSIAEHELEMADRWFSWVLELGGTDGHSLHLIPVSGLDISALIPKATKAFNGNVEIIKDEEEQTSDWQITDHMRSASGPNSAFRQVAWHFHSNNLGPYFWCELDCIPMRKDWIDRLEAEYKTCGKPFMGADVQIESVPPHMSGNGVYLDPVMNAPSLVRRTNWIPKGQDKAFELAFDIAGAREVLSKAHFTTLIQHKFRFKGFESRYEFDAVIDKNAVVFHSDKKGTIYKYLRENLSGRNVETNPSVEGTVQNSDSGEGLISHQATSAQNYFDSAWDAVRDDYKKLCGGAGEVIASGGIATEPASPQTTTEGSAVGFTRTFTPSDDLENVIKQNAVIKNGLPAMSPPWENREDTERDVKMLCDALALFAKAPIYKSRVRNALRKAKIIK